MDVLLTKYNQGANMHIGRRLQQCVKAGAVALTPGRYTPRLGDWHPAARHLQQERGVAILLMDIDVIFAGRLEGIFAGAHYGLMPRLAQKNWCKRTLGGAVFVSSSPLGRAFLDHACLHIRKFLTLGLY